MKIIYYDNIICIIECSKEEFKLIPNDILDDDIYASCNNREVEFLVKEFNLNADEIKCNDYIKFMIKG